MSDLTVLLYGPSKIGKSTFCSHAPGALFLATEAGLNHLDVYQTPIATWEQMLAACAEIARGGHDFRTVIIDTIDNAHRMCTDHICTREEIDHESDLEYGKAYAMINNEFYRVLNKLSLLPYGLIMVSHSQEKEVSTRTGKITRATPTLPDKARRIVVGMADLVLYADMESTPDGGERRVVRTKPSRSYDAGDRTGRLPDTVSLDYTAITEALGS